MNGPALRMSGFAPLLALLFPLLGCPSSATAPPDVPCEQLLDSPRCEGPGDCTARCEPPGECDCGSRGSLPPDVPAADGCALWYEDLTAANLASLHRFALSQGLAVVTGAFGDAVKLQYDTYLPMTITEVHFGWSFLVGIETMVRVEPLLVETLAGSSGWTVAFSQPHPTSWEQDERPVWGNALAFVPAEEASAMPDAVGYRTLATNLVAVVRIVAQDEYRTTFEVVDALQGTFPAAFQDNWYESWGLPYPDVADGEDEHWIASVYGLTEYPEGVVLGSVYDFRPATPEALAVVMAELESPYAPYDVQQLRAERDERLAGLRFHHSPAVVSSVVSGLAMECCTGAGGTFVEHEVMEVLRGTGLPPRFVIGGHAYYGEEACGDPFLYGLSTVVDPAPFMEEPFDCLEYPEMDSWDAYGPPITSGVAVRLPHSASNLALVKDWLTASTPLYQLYAPGAAVPAEALAQDPSNAPWSQPQDAVEAFVNATHIALIQVDEITYDAANDAHTVLFSTTFSTHEYEHLERYTVKLAFRCGDSRLLQEGSRLVGGLVLLDAWSYGADEGPDLTRSFLVPGALLPEWEMSDQLLNTLATFLN
jgi:hypothetical protein